MFKKNTAVTGFGIGHFINATTGAVVTTGTPTCKRTLDGTGGACANAASYNSDGAVWEIDLDAADMNGDVVVLSFTLKDCLPISYTIRTGTKLVSELNDLGGTAQTGDVYGALPANFSALGIESDGDLTKVNALDGHTPQTGDVFAELPTNFSDMVIEPATKWTDIVLADAGSAMVVTSATGGFTSDMAGRYFYFEADGVVRASRAIAYVSANEISCYNVYATELAGGNLTKVIGVVGGRVWLSEELHRAGDNDIPTILGRIKGTLDTGTHKPQSGDGYAVVAHADYGNAKLVRSATPANALAVGATGLVSLAADQEVNVTKWGGTAIASANVLIDGAITAAKIAASALNGKGDWNTTAPPTTAEIKAAIEAEGSHLALILADTGTDIPATLSTISGYVDCLPESWVIPSTFDPATDEVDVGKVSGEDVELGTIGVVGLKRVSA